MLLLTILLGVVVNAQDFALVKVTPNDGTNDAFKFCVGYGQVKHLFLLLIKHKLGLWLQDRAAKRSVPFGFDVSLLRLERPTKPSSVSRLQRYGITWPVD